MPSINFMAEIENFKIQSKDEQAELTKTLFDLTGNVLAKQEEKREVRKKIADLRDFFQVYNEK